MGARGNRAASEVDKNHVKEGREHVKERVEQFKEKVEHVNERRDQFMEASLGVDVTVDPLDQVKGIGVEVATDPMD